MTENPGANHQPESVQDQPILVAVDFSDDSRAAVLWAGEFANCIGTRLILLHVIHDPVSSPGFYHAETPGEMRPMEDIAKTMMTTAGSGAQNLPVVPGMNNKGTNATIVVMMLKVTGVEKSLAPLIAASM